MISTASAKPEFKEVIRDPATLPIEFQVGNPFLPRHRLIIDTFDRPDPLQFSVIGESVTPPTEPSGTEPMKAILESQLQFSRIDAQRMPNNPNSFDNLGISEMNSGDLDAAAAHFTRAIQLDSTFFPGWAHLAKIHLLRKDYEAALMIYRGLYRKRPGDRQLLLNMANILVELENFDEAQGYLKQILEAAPNNAHALSALGVVHLLKRELRPAINSFRKSLASNIRLIGSHNNLGVAYMMSRSYRRAEHEFQAMLALDSSNQSAVKNLAELYLIMNRCDRAVAVLEDFLRRNAGDIEARTLLALCQLNLGRYKDSLYNLTVAQKYSSQLGWDASERAKYSNNLGVVSHRLKAMDKAEEYYKQALDIPDPSRSTFCNLMQLYFDQRRLDDLRQIIENYSDVYPDDGWGTLFLSRYYVEVHDYDRAISLARVAALELPRATAPFALIGYVLTEIYGDYESAIIATREGLARDSQNEGMLNNLAYHSLMAGNVSAAATILNRIDPAEDNLFLRATRGLLRIWEGDVKRGSQHYNEAKRMASNVEMRSLVEQKKQLELGKHFLRQNQRSEAINHFRRVLEEESMSPVFRRQASQLLADASKDY